MMRFQYIGELPSGYDYKIFQTDNMIKIMGIAPDKEPIAFYANAEMKLSRLFILPNDTV